MRENAAALYLIDGFVPRYAIPNKNFTPKSLRADYLKEQPTILLNDVQGPVLTYKEAQELLEEIKVNGAGGTDYCGDLRCLQYRYKKGNYDFDVVMFVTDERILIEFRLADKWYQSP